MTVLAPRPDTAGAALDAQIATVQALVTANANPVVLPRLQAFLNQLQVEAVDHYMVTGWLNAAVILAAYPAPAWDRLGQAIASRVADLQSFYNNAPAPLPGNANGYGSAGWVTVAQNYAQQLYQAQIQLVEHLMDIGQPTAATMLANLTGSQSFTYEYAFTGVGFTEVDSEVG
jgi:hypothetical protein